MRPAPAVAPCHQQPLPPIRAGLWQIPRPGAAYVFKGAHTVLGALVKVGVCVALGAATTVAVAWGLALRGVPDGGPWSQFPCAWINPSTGMVTVYREGPSMPGILRITLLHCSGDATADSIEVYLHRPSRDYPRVAGPPRPCHPPEGRGNCREEYQFGWPLVCLWAVCDVLQFEDVSLVLGSQNVLRVWPLGNPSPQTSFDIDAMYPFSQNPQRHSWFVPTGILWRPFAINSTTYGAAWWLLLLAPGIARRALRRRRGQCVACGYDLTGNTTGICPECGKPTSSERSLPRS